MKLLLLALSAMVMLSACKRRSYRYPVQPPESVQTLPKQGDKEQQQPSNNYSRTGTVASNSPTQNRLSVQVVKQIQLGASIESFFANVYTKQGSKKSYIATKIPCDASQGETKDEGDFKCRFMENDLDIDVKIHRQGPQTASVSIPGDPAGPHELNCSLKYDYKAAHNRGPEATRDGSVLHRLQEVTCVE